MWAGLPGMEEFPRKRDVQCYNWGGSRKVELVTLLWETIMMNFASGIANTVHVNLSLSEGSSEAFPTQGPSCHDQQIGFDPLDSA